jgi:O-antigen/teichoic acid export membrane protein
MPPPGRSLRSVTARGGVVNAAFLTGAEALVLVQGLLATALLGPSAIGLYGVVTTTAMTIVALRRVGIDEAFVAAEGDEEIEFQRAFTVELGIGLAGSLVIAALAPVLAALYADSRLLPLTLAVAYLPLAFALEAPQWIFFRRMEYLRLRLLQVILPLGTVAVAVPLLLAGVGVWALVIGPFCGHVLAIAAALRVSPYRLRLRIEREAVRRYLRFSWPIFVTAVAALIVQQGTVAVFGLTEGLAAAGWITLAATLTRYADRADQIVATTIYPAIVRVRERVGVLEELFVKAGRLTLLWALPFGAGLALFGGDLVEFVLGDKWEPAVVLIGGLAVAVALQQIGYAWFAFYRARGESGPQAIESAWFAGSFVVVVVPATLAWESWGFVVGRVACTLCVLCVREVYVRRLLPGVRLAAVAARPLVVTGAACGAALLLRVAWGGERDLAHVLVELGVWLAVLGFLAHRLEGGLLREVRGYVRSSDPAPAPVLAGEAPVSG